MIAAEQVNPRGTRVFMGTITGEAELHPALIQAAKHFNVCAGTVELLGGLTEIEFTAYDFASQSRLPPLLIAGTLEIVGGHGTISMMADTQHVHLHLVVAYRSDPAPNGVAIAAGHVSRGIAYGVEFIMTAYDGNPVERAIHARTGLNLWKLPTIGL